MLVENVSDVLTKSLPRPAFEKHREYMIGTRVPFSVFYAGTVNLSRPIMTYVIKLSTPFYSKKDLTAYCVGGKFHHLHRGRVKWWMTIHKVSPKKGVDLLLSINVS